MPDHSNRFGARARSQYPHYSWRVQSPTSTLHYITDHQQADIALSQLLPGPLGFDLEWRPNFRKGGREGRVALVQLADRDTILLLQISAMSEFPSKLRALLANPSRAKAGVSIQHDCLKLFRDCGVSTLNCVELTFLARSVDNTRWKGKYTTSLGLSRLLETYENFSLAKGKVQCSNWETRLSLVQQDYAANDALAGYTIYTRLINLAQFMPNPNTLLPQYYSFSVVNGFLRDHHGIFEWEPQNPHYDPGPPPPPREPNAAIVTSCRTRPYRQISAATINQPYNASRGPPQPPGIIARPLRAPPRNTAQAAGSRGLEGHDSRPTGIIPPPYTLE